MNRNIWKTTAVAVAISAAAGMAFAQPTKPSADSHATSGHPDTSTDSAAHIISDQTKAPPKGMKDRPADSTSGPGAGSSSESAAEIISDQTQAPAGSSASDRSAVKAGTPGAPSTESAAHIIKDQTEPPSSAHGAHSTGSGTRK